VNNAVYALAIQAGGDVLLGGSFTTVATQPRNRIARLANPDSAVEHLACDAFSVAWVRQGSSPEVWRTTFDVSTDGTNWANLGTGTRTAKGWALSGVFAPIHSRIRARGFVTSSQYNGSGWFVEGTLEVSRLTPPVILSNDSAFGFQTNEFGFTVRALPGQAIVVEASTDFVTWIPVQTNLVTGLAQFVFREAQTSAHPHRFYRARVYEGSLPPPAILKLDNLPGFVDGAFAFAAAGVSGQSVVIDASTNLVNWIPLHTNTLVGTGFRFSDPGPLPPTRFYRVRVR
jgi:hypothetical protein